MKNRHVAIVSNREIAPSCFRVVLSGGFEDFNLQPGQFIMLKLGNGYDPLLRRPFAAFKVRTSEGIFLEIFYKVVGHGTRILSGMSSGTALELLGPLGNGFKIPDSFSTALILAGGMGIVPLRGLIHHLVRLKTKHIQVFLGAKFASHLLFQEELSKMDASLHFATEDGSAGYHGFITELFRQFLQDAFYPDKNGTICFACGPSAMLGVAARIAAQHQLPCQVSLESRMACGIGACLGCSVKLHRPHDHHSGFEKYGRVCCDGPVFYAQEIEWQS